VIFAALQSVIHRHPVLSLSILDEASLTPSFTRLREINLEEVVSFQKTGHDKTIESLVEIAHRKPFEHLGLLPLWRMIVIERTSSETFCDRVVDIGFFWHHVIGDGESGVTFHHDLLQAIQFSFEKKDISPIVIPPKQDLLPPLEDAVPLSLSFWFKLKTLFKVLFPSKPDPSLWTGSLFRAEDNTTHLRTLFLTPTLVDGLRTICREHKVTITSLLLVVIARVLCTMYPETSHFTSKTAISLRRFATVGRGEMVAYVTSLRHYFSSKSERGFIRCRGDFSWNAVKEARKCILDATATSKNQSIALLKYLHKPMEWFHKQPGMKRPDSFEISNLGLVEVDDGSVQMKRLLFSQSSNVIGPAYVFSIVTLRGGEMAIALTWQENIVTADSAENLLSGLQAELERLLKATE